MKKNLYKMGYGKSVVIVKNALIFLNFIYALVGLVVAAIGFVLLFKWTGWITIMACFYFVAAEVLVKMAALGCYGAGREKKGILIAYAVLILTLSGLQVTLDAWLSMDPCLTEAVIDHSAELVLGAGNTSHKAEPKECDSSLDVLTGVISIFLCIAFHDERCASNQDGIFDRWYLATNIVTVGVPFIEGITGCLALYLAIYLAVKERRSHTAEPGFRGVVKQAFVC